MSDVLRWNATDSHVVRSTEGLLKYLQDLVRKSRKSVRHHDGYDNVWWLAELPEGVKRPSDRRDGVLLTLEYEPQIAAPELPSQLAGWVDPAGINDPASEPVLMSERAERNASGQAELALRERVTSREEAPETLRDYRRWIADWRRWAAQERAARPRRDLRKELASAARKLSQHDDTQEAVLCIGLLTFRSPKGEQVRRHVVSVKVYIAVDRRTSKVTVALSDEAVPRVEDRLFLDGSDGLVVEPAEAIRDDITSQAPHLLSEQARQLVQQWQSHAFDRPIRFSDSWHRPETIDDVAAVTLAPALILRQRDQSSLIDYYDRMLETLARPSAAAPLGLAQLLFPMKSHERLAWHSQAGGQVPRLIGDDPLFPLPTNEAQRLVFERLKRDTAVVVQGPPGTGKTHTIANLVAALLADGKRVLVTSAKDQALEVLRDKLPEPLRDLCVRLTHQRGGGSDELERTLTALSDQAAVRHLDEIQQSITTLEDRRRRTEQRKATLREQVFELREAETLRREVAPGYAGTRADIVEAVQAREDRYNWLLPFPDKAPSDPPVTVSEALDLCQFLTEDSSETELQVAQYLPDPASLPTLERLAELVASITDAPPRVSARTALTEALGELQEVQLREIARALEAAADALHRLGIPQQSAAWDTASWTTVALRDHLAGNNAVLWQHVTATAAAAQEHLKPLSEQAARHIDTGGLSDAEVARAIQPTEALLAFLSNGGRLRGFFPKPTQRDARSVLMHCEVDGRPLQTVQDLNAVLVELRVRKVIAAAVHAWDQVEAAAPSGSQLAILSQLRDRASALEDIAGFSEACAQAEQVLVTNRIRRTLRTPEAWDELFDGVEAALSGLTARLANRTLDDLATEVCPPIGASAPETVKLHNAIRRRDPDDYAQTLLAVVAAHQRRERRQRGMQLFQRLKDTHPPLAESLSHTAATGPWRDRLAELDEAWAWGHAWAFCQRVSAPDRDQKLQSQLAEADQRLATTLAELAAEHAWRHCLSRMTVEQKKALQVFKNRMADYGKGTSRRYAGRYRSSARSAMADARAAVPAWIMPIPLVVETIPAAPDSFDVVIIDEASQAHVDATFLLWLAPHVIVVGDDRQCSPSATSRGELQPLFELLETYLPDVEPAHRLEFSPKSNLYKLLTTHFPEVVRLTDHFRCMPEIIGWSSQFYDNRLVPLRQFGADRLDPLKVERVEGGYTEGVEQRIRNEVEARAIIARLKEMLASTDYGGKTFGIIVLQGSGQIQLLERLLGEEIDDPAIIEERKIRVGGAQDFQGDARDVILLSMVVDGSRSPRALGGREAQQRFNVAASRARDQMWLFSSVPAHRLKPNDLRHSLLTYMTTPPRVTATAAELANVRSDVPQEPFDSLFEQKVFLNIRDRGYRVIPQVRAGNRKVIDLVVEGRSGRLGIECDGRYWHTSREQVQNDIVRELELRRADWHLWRVREGDFLLDPDQALQPLWRELDRRGITADIGLEEASPAESNWVPLDLPESDEDLWKEE